MSTCVSRCVAQLSDSFIFFNMSADVLHSSLAASNSCQTCQLLLCTARLMLLNHASNVIYKIAYD